MTLGKVKINSLTSLRKELKSEKLDNVIVKERARLYWLAHNYFPYLLHMGNKWSKNMGMDSSHMAFMSCMKGLFAEGRRLENFDLLSREAA